MNSEADTFISLMIPSRRRAWIALGLWMRIFIAALAVEAGAVALLVGGTSSPNSTIAFLFGGGVLAALAWRRGKTALDRSGARIETSVPDSYVCTPFTLAGVKSGATMQRSAALK